MQCTSLGLLNDSKLNVAVYFFSWDFAIKYERGKCVYQECVALMICSKTNAHIPMIMSIKTHKTLRNHEKNTEGNGSPRVAKSLRET